MSSFTASHAPADLLAAWPSAQRLYTLSGPGAIPSLLVESFTCTDAVSELFELQLDLLSLDAHLDLDALLRQPLTLHTVLADGTRSSRSGLVIEASSRDANGGFAAYRLLVQPFLALLQHSGQPRSWQDKTLPQIVDEVLQPFAGIGAWQWGEVDEHGGSEHLDGFFARGPHGGVYPFCLQYRETDFDFVQRLLRHAGMGWRVAEDAASPSGHRVVFFADSYRWPENPVSRGRDASRKSSAPSTRGPGIRFQRAAAVEEQDSVQAWGGMRSLQPGATTTLHWDARAKRSVAASVATHLSPTGPALAGRHDWLEVFDAGSAEMATGQPNGWNEAQQRARLLQEGFEARNKTWLMRCTVRSLRPGQWFLLSQSTLDRRHTKPKDRQFGVLRVDALGINNLPRELGVAIAERLGTALDQDELFGDAGNEAGFDGGLDGEFDREFGTGFGAGFDTASDGLAPSASPRSSSPAARRRALADDPQLRQQAQRLGYACRAEALRRQVPWRPLPEGWERGEPLLAHAASLGLQTAIVVGPDGSPTPRGADELHTDGRGRVLVRFHWQRAHYADGRWDNSRSIWVRVAQGWAGPGMGHQFLPRIGAEVLLSFVGGWMELPIVTGSLYNGRGEGGVPRTPGGEPAGVDNAVFAGSSDHRPAGQANLAGGNSPAWHGAAPGEARPGAPAQNNAAALSGLKSKEFGGIGFSQLVYDDTPGQLRVQYATTQHATQLNLGHLVHQADNHRGSFRGMGFELRSDARGALRGARGVIVATYCPKAHEPAGDNVAATALLKQAVQLTDTFNRAATTHQTTPLAGSIGSTQPGQSVLSRTEAPMQALLTAARGMVDERDFNQALADAAQRNTQPADGQVPHSADPIVTLAGRAGLGVVAGQDLQLAAGDQLSLQAGQDVQVAGGEQLRLHTGQSLGVLAGAVQPGEGAAGTGLTMIAAQGPVDLQAQAGAAQVAAKGLIDVKSAFAHIDWAAAKKIVLTTKGGAQVVLSAEGFLAQCTGKMTVHAAQKRFIGPAGLSYPLPGLPRSPWTARELHFDLKLQDVPGPQGHPLAHAPWKIVRSPAEPQGMDLVPESELVLAGESDHAGAVKLDAAQEKRLAEAFCAAPGGVWLMYPGHAVLLRVQEEAPDWTPDQRLLQALSAADFSADVHGHRAMSGANEQIWRAKTTLDEMDDSSLPGRLKS